MRRLLLMIFLAAIVGGTFGCGSEKVQQGGPADARKAPEVPKGGI